MKGKVLASCSTNEGINGFEALVNEYFYSKHWSVTNGPTGWKAFNPILGRELEENGFGLREQQGRYQLIRLEKEPIDAQS